MKTRIASTLRPGYPDNSILPRPQSAALLLLCLFLSLAPTAWAQDCSGDQCPTETGPPVVTVTQVDDQAFPQVTVSVTVSDPDGIPLDELTNVHFQLYEDGNRVPNTAFSVERNDEPSLGLVLALDVSTSPEALTELQIAATSLIDALPPQVQMAVVAFYDQVQLEQGFTRSKADLKAAIENLQAQGNYTSLNQAVQEAAALVGGRDLDRKAVVLFTDSASNIGTLSTADAINTALQANVSLYPIGLEPKAQPLALADMADLTGGQSFMLTCYNEAAPSLQTIQRHLHPGYRITFESSLPADDAGHDLSVGVTYQGEKGQAAGRLTALSDEVSVSLLGVTDGQKVSGLVNLAARATGPADIVSLEYLLNDQPLAQRSDAPYGFDWDSSALPPQTYTLSVRATDRAGNQGQAQARLQVVPPITLTLSASQPEVQTGETITVEAQVQALAQISQIEFLLDDQPLDNVPAPPYRLALEGSTQTAGEHTLTARAQDELGRQAQASLSLQFLPPPQPEPPPEAKAESKGRDWSPYLNVVVALIALLAAISTAILALVLILMWQRKRYQKQYRLSIQNLGNVRSRYKLLAQEPAGALAFQFTLNGNNLHERQITETIEVEPEQMPSPSRPPARSAQPARPAMPSAPGGLQEAKDKAGQAASAGKGLTGLLASLGALLPGSMGQSLRGKASQASMQQSKIDYAVQAPDRLGKRVQDVAAKTPQSAELASKTSSAAQEATTAAPALEPAEAPSQPATPRAQATGVSPVAAPPEVKTITRTVVEEWAQTPVVEPGQSLTVTLRIAPIQRPRRAESYPFTVTSQTMEQRRAPTVVQQGEVRIKSGAWFRYYLPPTLLFLAVLAIEVLALGFILNTIGILG